MINQSNESSILQEEYQIHEAITEFTVSIINVHYMPIHIVTKIRIETTLSVS